MTPTSPLFVLLGVQTAALCLIAWVLWTIRFDLRTYLGYVQKHGTLTDESNRKIGRKLDDLPTKVTGEVIGKLAQAGVPFKPDPPPPAGTPANPAEVTRLDQPVSPTHPTPPPVRGALVLAAALVGVGLTAWAGTPEVKAMDADREFAAGDYAGAEYAARAAGDRHGAAEAALAAGRPDDAVRHLDGCDDGKADYIRGVVADLRGDPDAARAMFLLARDRGFDLARVKLAQLGEG